MDSPSVHHAYLLTGGALLGESFLHSFWSERGMTLTGSPDFFVFKEALFGINEARALSVAAARKAFTDRKVFFIAPEKITIEAQNALLKTFEDPYENTHFFLVVREEELILPTLRSRMQIHRLGANEDKTLEAEKFLTLSYKDRINFAKKFADAEKNLSVFLDELMIYYRSKGLHEKVKSVYAARRFSDDRATAPRLIIEHLSLVL